MVDLNGTSTLSNSMPYFLDNLTMEITNEDIDVEIRTESIILLNNFIASVAKRKMF